jgi:hypothetical protein
MTVLLDCDHSNYLAYACRRRVRDMRMLMLMNLTAERKSVKRKN